MLCSSNRNTKEFIIDLFQHEILRELNEVTLNNTGATRVLTAWGRHGRRFARLFQHVSSAETKAGLRPLHSLSPRLTVQSEETRGATAEEDVWQD